VRDVQGQWHECIEARFSVDATGRGRHRLDFAGGADGRSLLPIGRFSLGRPGDSKSTETGIRTDWSNGRLPVRWSRQLGESYGIGAVYQGHYYQFDRHGDVAQLLCLDAETGAEQWRFEYPTEYRDMYGYNGGPRCSPIIDQDRIYLFGAEGMLHCVRTADGQLLWKVDTARQFGVVQNFFGVGSNPVIEGSLLIVMVGGSPRQSQQVPRGALDRVVGDNSGIVAFDKMTGRVVYQITDELASYASLKACDHPRATLVLCVCPRGVGGVRAVDGQGRFSLSLASVVAGERQCQRPGGRR
jgi:outer membrane protein assembly factor BamB